MDTGRRAVRLEPAGSLSLQAVAVVHGELHRFVAHDVLRSQLLLGPGECPAHRRRQSAPAVRRGERERRRTRLHPRLEHARQRLRRAVQAHDRAVHEHPADDRDRRLQPDHQDRLQRFHRRKLDELYLRPEQPCLREAAGGNDQPGAGNRDRRSAAVVLHRRPIVAERSAVHQRLQHDALEVLAARSLRPYEPDAGIQYDVPRRAGPAIPGTADDVALDRLQLDDALYDQRRLEPPVLHRGQGRATTTPICSTTT